MKLKLINLISNRQREAFCDALNAPKSFLAEALARTPLGELTTLPQTA